MDSKRRVYVEGGGAFFAPGDRQRQLPAAKRQRAELIAWALHRAGLRAYVPSAADMRYGPSTFESIADSAQLPLLASNLRRIRDDKLAFADHVRVSTGGTSLLLIGLVDPATWPPGLGLDANDPLLAARRVIQRHARTNEPIVLVTSIDLDAAMELAAKLPRVNAVLVAQRNMQSFLPREFKRGADPVAHVPLVAAGHGGQQIARFDLWLQVGERDWRGGVWFEDAREQWQMAATLVDKNPDEASAVRARAGATLDKLRGHTRYRYQWIELGSALPRDAATLRRQVALSQQAQGQ